MLALELEGKGEKVPARFALERGDNRFRPPPKQDGRTEVPVILGDVPLGFQRNPNPEGTLADGVDATELLEILESHKK